MRPKPPPNFKFNTIADLLFLGDAIDLPYYDFVVGVEEIESGIAKAYNCGEGEELKQRLMTLEQSAILHLNHQQFPLKDVTQRLMDRIDVKPIKSTYAIALLYPSECENQIQFVKVPEEFLAYDDVKEESPIKLLSMMRYRLLMDLKS